MTDYKKRIKTLERRLGIDSQDEGGINKIVIIYPPKSDLETEAEYQARMSNAELLPGEPGEPARYGYIIELGR